jgi:hypothetical protein
MRLIKLRIRESEDSLMEMAVPKIHGFPSLNGVWNTEQTEFK